MSRIRTAKCYEPIRNLVYLIYNRHFCYGKVYQNYYMKLGKNNYYALFSNGKIPTLRAVFNALYVVLPEHFMGGANITTATVVKRALEATKSFNHKSIAEISWEEITKSASSTDQRYHKVNTFINQTRNALVFYKFIQKPKRKEKVDFFDGFDVESDTKTEESTPLQSINVSFSETEQEEEVKEKEVLGFRGYLFRIFKAILGIS